MKILDVPHKSISDVKRAPMDIFKEAEELNNGVYIFNRNKVAGVILTQEQYESLNNEIEALYERIDEMEVKSRLADSDRGRVPVNEVIGYDLSSDELDEDDGWE